MERARHRSSPSCERFLGSFLHSAAAGDQPGSTAFELDEDDLFASEPDPPSGRSRRAAPSSYPPSAGLQTLGPSPASAARRRASSKPSPSASGLSPPPSSSSTTSSSASPAAAPPRMIPTIPRPAAAPAPHMPQSAPVNVPSARLRRPPVEAVMGDAEDDDDEMLPPHEMVARARARESPMTTFSVLEAPGARSRGGTSASPMSSAGTEAGAGAGSQSLVQACSKVRPNKQKRLKECKYHTCSPKQTEAIEGVQVPYFREVFISVVEFVCPCGDDANEAFPRISISN